MEISRTLLKDFAKAVNKSQNEETKNTSSTVYGTTVISDGKKYVQIDGSSTLTPISEATEAEDGDRVLVTIENHEASVIGNYTYPASARKAINALEKAELAVVISEESKLLIDGAVEKADEAKAAAQEVSSLANQAKTDATEALAKAEIAESLATKSEAASSEAQAKIEEIQNGITDLQNGLAEARQEAADSIDAVVETMETEYAMINDVVVLEGTLRTEIAKSAAELQTTMSENYAAKNDLASIEGNLQTQITQNAQGISQTASKVESLETDTDSIREDVQAAQTAAQGAQAAAEAAQEAAENAQAKANEADIRLDEAKATLQEAKNDLDAAIATLEELLNSGTATPDEISAAQAAVDNAQTAVDMAEQAVAEAKESASVAKLAADEAKEAADEAKATADKAKEDLEAITSRVVTAETKIQQNADAIALSATKTEVYETLEGYYTKEETNAQIQVSADGITQTVSDVEYTASEAKDSADGLDERMKTAESIIEQLADCISMMVTDENGSTLMTQNGNGYTFNIGPIQEMISNLSEDINGDKGLKASYDAMMASIAALQGSYEDNKETFEHVSISVYEDEPAIYLGESDSDFKVIITNTRIIFLRGSNPGTYVDTDGLNTDNITVNKELKQGGFAWVVHGNGNLGLVWKGA